MKSLSILIIIVALAGCATQAEQESAYIGLDAAEHLLKESPQDLRRQTVKSVIVQTVNRIGKPSSSPAVPNWSAPSEVSLLKAEIAKKEGERIAVERARIAQEARKQTEASAMEIERLKAAEAELSRQAGILKASARNKEEKHAAEIVRLKNLEKVAIEDSKRDGIEKGIEQGKSLAKKATDSGIPWLETIGAAATAVLGAAGIGYAKVKKSKKEAEVVLERVAQAVEKIPGSNKLEGNEVKTFVKSVFSHARIPELNAAVDRLAGRK